MPDIVGYSTSGSSYLQDGRNKAGMQAVDAHSHHSGWLAHHREALTCVAHSSWSVYCKSTPDKSGKPRMRTYQALSVGDGGGGRAATGHPGWLAKALGAQQASNGPQLLQAGHCLKRQDVYGWLVCYGLPSMHATNPP